MSVGVRHIPCSLLAAALFCAPVCALSQDGDSLEARPINTTAKVSKDETNTPIPAVTARTRKPFSLPPLAADPVFEIERLWREAFYGGAIDLVTDAPERGESKDVKTVDWRVPKEEPPPVPKPVAAAANTIDPEQPRQVDAADDAPLPTAKPAKAEPKIAKAAASPVAPPSSAKPAFVAPDPEAGRSFDLTDVVSVSPAAPKLQLQSPARTIAQPDPESGRAISLLEPADGPQIRPESKAVAQNTAKRLAPLDSPELAPRIERGGALDKDDPKPPVQPTAAKREVAVTAPPAPPVTPTAAPNAKPPAQNTNAKQKDTKKKDGLSANPEEREQQLMQEIKERQKNLDELYKAARERMKEVIQSQLPPGLMIRDEHELKVITTLLDPKRKVGSVQLKVFDVVTKQPLLARVQLIDTTETVARAPLSSGFWCRGGTPAINVVSGPVLVEVHHGGRFCAAFRTGLEVKAGQLSQIDVPMAQTSQLNFEARGWMLADFDLGLKQRPGENAVWFGNGPTVADLVLAAKCEGVRIVGVTLPLGDEEALNGIRRALENPDPDVLVLPVFPGPRNRFNGSGMGLGVTDWDGLKADSAIPEIPLREGFEAIRARDGLAVFKDLKGLRSGNIEREVYPVYRRLKENNYFGSKNSGEARLFAGGELAFDTLTGAYDVLSFDGTDAAEAVWFNLLNEGAPVRVIGSGGGSLQGGRIPYGQTFLQVDGAATREKVLGAIKGGRTMVSFGPAVFAKVFERDMGPGAVLPTDGRELSLQVQAYSSVAASTQLETIEIIRNGKVVYTQTAANGETEVHDLRFPLRETSNAWYVVRVTERTQNARGTVMEAPRRAWTSPIFFRNPSFAPPAPAVTHIRGVLRKGLTPMRGVVTALAVGMPTRRIETGPDGVYDLTVPSTATLIFEAPECEPVARRIFEHPKVQRGIGTLTAADDMLPRLADRAAFGLWRLLLSDLDWDITLVPMEIPAEPAETPVEPASEKLPEPE